ncbi:MAG: signal recognition particle-docking protein FtsY [Candidatus Improbicoccus pseudotrichonymphae]|uniref:Signal recognition particle receptor FtsY n=1 Tax=Candidatus Improbicoccus pseudotrichonymphae TaxID=3033792 RepID=A0AA48KX24_9FIRM|nr:MAG: signal recognition particle-docking protein FtsY [Candidatus Improbicoccus pseudotrichonymphae]
MNFFSKIKDCFKKTSEKFISGLESIFNSFKKIDEDFLNKLEEVLILSDISLKTASKIKDRLRNAVKSKNIEEPKEITEILKGIIVEILNGETKLNLDNSPSVILFSGINGSGKTTTLAKFGYKFKNDGKKVLFSAADTFRAAAVEQLDFWAKKIGCEITKKENSDPGTVIYESIERAKKENFDIVLCDTAGRLHNKENLMSELGKINRIIGKKLYENYESILVIDSNIGQNALVQASEFSKILKITGLILTKLDGTSKGGIAISIKDELDIPIKYICTGEKQEDLVEFNARSFCDAIFENK